MSSENVGIVNDRMAYTKLFAHFTNEKQIGKYIEPIIYCIRNRFYMEFWLKFLKITDNYELSWHRSNLRLFFKYFPMKIYWLVLSFEYITLENLLFELTYR